VPFVIDGFPPPVLTLCIPHIDILDSNKAQAYGIKVESSKAKEGEIFNFQKPAITVSKSAIMVICIQNSRTWSSKTTILTPHEENLFDDLALKRN
jgi:hypothetical protein